MNPLLDYLNTNHERQRLGADWSCAAWCLTTNLYLVEDDDGDRFDLVRRDVELDGREDTETELVDSFQAAGATLQDLATFITDALVTEAMLALPVGVLR